MSTEQLQDTNMSSKADAAFVKKSRRSRRSEPGDGSFNRRLMFLVLIASYAVFTYHYIRKRKTTLPRYQQSALIMFYAVYVLRTGVASFYLRMDRYYSWLGLIGLGLIMWPMLTFPMALFAEPFMEWNPGCLFWASCCLYTAGSLIHTVYEFTRFMHKQSAKGHKLYRNGLAVIVRHPNYYGDLLIFSGWALMTNNPWTLGIPAFQFFYFYFFLIPSHDEYLKAKYGRRMYEDYEYHVKGLVPFLM